MFPTHASRGALKAVARASIAGDGFVGRREELAFLHEAFALARDGHTRFAPVEGEAGIGKSRLIAEFAGAVALQSLPARAECSEHVRNPYGPFPAIFEQIGAQGLARPLATRGQRPHATEKAAFFESAVRAFHRAADRKPVVAILEDLQWADSATLELLKYLMQNLRSARALVILALRTGDAGEPHVAAFRHFITRQRIAAVRLHGLHRNEIRRLIAGENGDEMSAETLARIEALSEGNPLFAQELARIAIESGALNLATHAPLSLQAMLGERLTRLHDDERAILVRAAIVGRRFDAEFLAGILDQPLERVLHAIQRAVSAGVLLAVEEHPFEFVFRHAMLRQAFADQMIVGLAAPLHVRIARAIENSDDGEQRVAELAYHWSEARVADRARLYNERAAEAAWSVYAYRDAVGFYSTALRWDYPPGRQRASLYERVGTLLSIEGLGEEPLTWFERSRAEFAKSGDMEGASRALLRLADQYWVDARTVESLAASERAAAAIVPLDNQTLATEALLSLARYAVTLGDARQARRHLSTAESFRSSFDTALLACYHEVSAETHAATGHARDALHDCRIASTIAREAGSSELIAQIENNYALVAFDLGELDVAMERHKLALDEARRTSMNWRVAYSALNYANTMTFKGDLSRARVLAWEAIESGVTTATFKTKAAAVGIPLALLLNDRSLLDACADENALTYAARSGEPQRIATVTAAFAQLRLAQGAQDEARVLLERAIEQMTRTHRCLSLMLYAAEADDPHGRAWAEARLADAPLRPRVRRACRLLYHAVQGRHDATRHRLAAAAAAACERVGWHLHRARALEAAGRIAEAHAFYAAMGDVRDAERTRPHRSDVTPAIDLSPRQMEIARLVADGKTNRTIAQQLHISEHTVEHHLSSIFSRLGLRSRSALAAYVGRISTI